MKYFGQTADAEGGGKLAMALHSERKQAYMELQASRCTDSRVDEASPTYASGA
jgi:hypothetical protein